MIKAPLIRNLLAITTLGILAMLAPRSYSTIEQIDDSISSNEWHLGSTVTLARDDRIDFAVSSS